MEIVESAAPNRQFDVPLGRSSRVRPEANPWLKRRIDWKADPRGVSCSGELDFLNTATFGQLPRRTTQAVVGHFAHRDETACADFLEWFDDVDAFAIRSHV